MKDAEHVTFGGSGLDRAAERRGDAEALLADPGAKVMPVWRGKPLLEADGEARRGGWIAPDHGLLAGAPRVFLGLDDGAPRFAADVSGWEPGETAETVGAFVDPSEQRHPDLPDTQAFAELRQNMIRLSAREAELAATAKAILGWHVTHRFCAQCGAESSISQGGWQRTCPACGAHHFPRTDPVVIMLITHGNNVLMGRSPGWPEGMYSLLAGFVEPGETIEAAVRREVFEETSVRVGEVSYLASQPWPFPSSLMIGCHGHATSREITIDPAEIEAALWVSREDMMEIVAGHRTDIRAARKGSIAHFLVTRWLSDSLD
ncbi:NAD(+) diphosphatase [Ovoidimarina sediminis]|uniref:NAD(+) diphosphatase n=1 Tax=Ovoidimarina sediminis TaxID=3079856 RepID=UPI002915A2D1|nr:NAD(+) diphosphatase [Rhodophyticola sp. MJ-SS7]MDU8944409.1 NAD(+) diphosphatase [Rhodophyticola sp. MJ-SS7]